MKEKIEQLTSDFCENALKEVGIRFVGIQKAEPDCGVHEDHVLFSDGFGSTLALASHKFTVFEALLRVADSNVKHGQPA